VVTTATIDREALLSAYGDYARSAEGAGSVQPRVVQRLVEAVYEHLFPEAPRLDVERLAKALIDSGLMRRDSD